MNLTRGLLATVRTDEPAVTEESRTEGQGLANVANLPTAQVITEAQERVANESASTSEDSPDYDGYRSRQHATGGLGTFHRGSPHEGVGLQPMHIRAQQLEEELQNLAETLKAIETNLEQGFF